MIRRTASTWTLLKNSLRLVILVLAELNGDPRYQYTKDNAGCQTKPVLGYEISWNCQEDNSGKIDEYLSEDFPCLRIYFHPLSSISYSTTL
jgi:hypothetical protein